MGFYLSPMVAVNEIDSTTTIPAVATSIAVILLRNSYKGPEMKTTLVTSTNDLIEKFGMPTNTQECYEDILSATGFLRYGSALYCTRVMPVSASFAGTTATSGASATFVGYGESELCLANLVSLDPDEFANEDVGLVEGTDIFKAIAISRGAWGNNIKMAVIDKATYDNIRDSASPESTWSIYSAIREIDSPLETSYDFLVVLYVLDQTGKAYAIKEYFNVSTDEESVDDEGKKRFVETVINNDSKYIRISLNSSCRNQPITVSTAEWQSFSGGCDYNPTLTADPVTSAQMMMALDLYGNAEEIDVNVFIDSNSPLEVKKYMVSTIVGTRKDSMAILDCPKETVIYNRGSEAQDLSDYRRADVIGIGDIGADSTSSYVAIYGNWLEVYDKWNGKFRWIPASGFVAGIFANTDSVSDPWFAPAGLNRGVLLNVRRLAWSPTKAERDILYKNGMNPITSFSGQGKTIWGQKTLLDKESAFNRINVRRLFLVLEKAIATASKYFLFEPNDDLTRLLLVNMVDPFLRDVRARRGLYDYMIVCDETNNTSERIDRNELWADIYLKATRSSEYIVLNFIATKTGASFTELIGNYTL